MNAQLNFINTRFVTAVSCSCLISFSFDSLAACENYAPSSKLTSAEQNQMTTSCSSSPNIVECEVSIYKQKYQSSIHNFLVSCNDNTNENYQKATAELMKILSTQNIQPKKENGALEKPTTIASSQQESEKPKEQPKATDYPPAQTKHPWLVTLSAGSQQLPDYEGGQSSGFSKSQAFAEIIADYRSGNDSGNADYHWGTFLTLEGQPVNRAEATAVNDIEFNDVADTLTAGVYYINMFDPVSEGASDWRKWFSPITQPFGTSGNEAYTSEWGWGGKLSIRSRETIGAEKDSVDPIAELGLHYRYTEHNGNIGKGNVMPKGTLSFGIGYWDQYEQYLGELGNAENRWRFLVRGEYRLSDTIPAYLGFKGNLGKGPDTLGVYLSLRMKSDKLLGLLSDAKTEN